MPCSCQHDEILEISAGPHHRENAVVSVCCEEDCTGIYTLTDQATSEELFAQCTDGEMTFIIPQMAAGEVKRYQIGPSTEIQGGVVIEEQATHCDVIIGSELLTRYVFGGAIARPYCYPLHGPGGVELTNFAPSDHIHHKSLYVAHGSINGYDNWSELEGHARTVVEECRVTQGPVYGEILAIGDWVNPEAGKLLCEQTRWRFYNLPDTRRFIDVTTTWLAAYQGVLLGDTKEAGTISVRVNEQMEVKNGGTFVNAYGGINDDECWGKRAPWVDYYGTVDGQQVGIAIFDHPHNYRHPTWWHVRSYGLFTANCWGLHDFYDDFALRGDHSMPQGDVLQFNFRLYLHAEDTIAADVSSRYLDYAFPPKVEELG